MPTENSPEYVRMSTEPPLKEGDFVVMAGDARAFRVKEVVPRADGHDIAKLAYPPTGAQTARLTARVADLRRFHYTKEELRVTTKTHHVEQALKGIVGVSDEERAEIMALPSEEKKRLLIGYKVHHDKRELWLWRGDLLRMVIPFQALETHFVFESDMAGRLDYTKVAIVDRGQTLRVEVSPGQTVMLFGSAALVDCWEKKVQPEQIMRETKEDAPEPGNAAVVEALAEAYGWKPVGDPRQRNVRASQAEKAVRTLCEHQRHQLQRVATMNPDKAILLVRPPGDDQFVIGVEAGESFTARHIKHQATLIDTLKKQIEQMQSAQKGRVFKTLICPTCRRDYGMVRHTAGAVVEVMCEGCQAEGRSARVGEERRQHILSLIDAQVEAWHASGTEDGQLHEYLDLTWDEYSAWAKQSEVPDRLLKPDAKWRWL